MRIYNSLSRKIEEFKPQHEDLVTMYCCGPTVYMYTTIGNFRTYFLADLVDRTLIFNGYKVHYIMNITDVGHLSGDNDGDPDRGADKMEKSAEKEGKSAKEIAEFYTKDFLRQYDKLNLKKPIKFTKATEYIDKQIQLVGTLEDKGYSYRTSDGIYFDTARFKDYGKLSGLSIENIKEGARVEINPEKRNPTDFALWKFSPSEVRRQQEWDSPWGRGYPGWHLECSAMSLAELGESIDIHLGGEDLKMIHHQNELAQSECATGKEFVKYWIHGAFMQVEGGRMGKSLGNAYTLTDLEEKGFDPMVLRYFYMMAHYRSPLNFTWEALQNAQNSLKKLYDLVSGLKPEKDGKVSEKYLARFKEKVNDDINMPEALAVMWEMLKNSISEASKLATVVKMDEILGLRLDEKIGYEIPQKIMDLARTRIEYRKNGIWDKADVLRRQISDAGFVVEDLPDGTFKVKKRL
jgi:cysteinyl-tRNA synthetase